MFLAKAADTESITSAKKEKMQVVISSFTVFQNQSKVYIQEANFGFVLFIRQIDTRHLTEIQSLVYFI